jgi:hypothetical protein
MKSKILLPLILLPLILTRASYGETLPELPDGQDSGYGIEPERLYPGTMILEILAAAEAEIDLAVEEAYAEGYKAASLRYEPEHAGLLEINRRVSLSLEGERQKTKRFWQAVFITGGISFFGGFLTRVLTAQ